MKGDPKVLAELSNNLSAELSAINQYFLHAEMCEDWGYDKLSKWLKKESIDEMKHAEEIIERILFLEGIPNMTKYQKLTIGKTVEEMFKNDIKLEEGAIKDYNKSIKIAAAAGDHGTAELFKKILKDEEGHYDFYAVQLEQIEQMGLQNYLALQTEED